MTTGSGRTIVYDLENRPTSVTQSGTTTTFVYDGDGGRVKKTAGSTTTVYIGQLYVCDNGACTKMIFAGETRVAQKEVTGGATSYYHADHLGSTSVVTDGLGNNVEDLAYYPYGDSFLDVGSQNVKFKYTGQEKDDSIGLYFYQARYYDAFLGRFISADTIVPEPFNPQSLNRYSYVINNPIIYTDPSGHFWKSVKNFFRAVGNDIVRGLGGGGCSVSSNGGASCQTGSVPVQGGPGGGGSRGGGSGGGSGGFGNSDITLTRFAPQVTSNTPT